MNLDKEKTERTFNEFAARTGIKLSNRQKEAVTSVDGPTLLLAVPGSGKTTVLISRLGYMIYSLGISPESILTMTYTVSAANDMKKRFVKMFGTKDTDRLEFRTINGVCEKILMYYAKTEHRETFSVAEEGDTGKILFDICKEKLEDYPTDGDIQEVRTAISYAKNMMLGDSELADIGTSDLPFPEIFSEYKRIMRANRLMDYDDQLVYARQVLMKYPSILEHYRRTFRYICVDEAQDTSKIQHEIISMLSGRSGNLFMVGDEDQSIYGFRAAYPDALINFSKDHPGAKILFMERNYRSDANIVSVADKFIKQNIRRYDKNMQPNRPAANEIKLIPVKSRYEQYYKLADIAENCTEQTAVLYRDNDSSLPLVDILERSGIPFNIRTGDYSFFSNKTVIDIRAIIDFSRDRKNTNAFMRIYSKMSLYLRRDDAINACKIAKQTDADIIDVLMEMQGLSEGTKSAILSFRRNLILLRKDNGTGAITRIISTMEYYKWLKKNNISMGRILILMQLASTVDSADELLNRIDELENMLRNREYNPSAKFIMTTVHSAKGLEYKNVYIIDIADGIFPVNIPSEKEKAEMVAKGREPGVLDPKLEKLMKNYEEERRLFYVAVTRAIDVLNIFTISGMESEFTDCLLKGKNAYNKSDNQVTYDVSFDEYSNSLQPGVKVIHKKYGPGTIIARNGDNAVIAMADGDRKTISLRVTHNTDILRKAEFN